MAIAQPTEGRSVEPASPRASSLLSPGRGGAHAGARTRSQPAGLRNMATVLEHRAFLDLAKQYDWAGIEQAITANPAIVKESHMRHEGVGRQRGAAQLLLWTYSAP